MAVKSKKSTIPDRSTQRYLPFTQIRENIMIMKDSSARMVLSCSTVNFLLKSTEEQDSIIMTFQRFLNALDFPVQIMVRSTKLDINGYLEKLWSMALKQKNTLLQNQTYEYIEYLRKLVEIAQIMKKEFYIVVPYDQDEGKSVRNISFFWAFQSFWSAINGGDDLIKVRSQIRNFSNIKKWISTRVNSVRTSLESIGIRATPLGKEDLIKLLTDYYNPSLENLTVLKEDAENFNIVKS